MHSGICFEIYGARRRETAYARLTGDRFAANSQFFFFLKLNAALITKSRPRGVDSCCVSISREFDFRGQIYTNTHIYHDGMWPHPPYRIGQDRRQVDRFFPRKILATAVKL